MDTMRQEQNVTLDSSGKSNSFIAHVRAAGIPSLIVSALIFGLYAWDHFDPSRFSDTIFTIISFVLYAAFLFGLTVYFGRNSSREMLLTRLVVAGLCIGVLVAIGKLILVFRLWALFRLIAEPITTALVALAIGYIVSARRKVLH
jgi:hypothetical protein